MDIEGLLKNRKTIIDKRLDEILPAEKTYPVKLHKAMRYSVFSGGKRIRPILAIESCLCCGGEITDVIDAACAIELVHTFSLIHDDLPAMDDDDYRRGKLTCHKRFDEATAILAGDALLSLAFEVLAEGKKPATDMKSIKELGRSIGSLGMAGGQAVDIDYESKAKDLKTLNYINQHKTGALISASMKMGALAAGAPPEKVKAMSRFGTLIGEVFQLVDDILDNGGYVSMLGKKTAQKKVSLLTRRANKALSRFNGSADTLKSMADYLAARKI